MERTLPLIQRFFPAVHPNEFVTAVWLHNVDRTPGFRAAIATESIRTVLLKLLQGSPFDTEARERIVSAADPKNHGRRDDDPADTLLLGALRLADKWDRIGPLGVIGGPAFRGSRMLPYDPGNPFGYEDTAEHGMKTLYHDFFRILEWVRDFPLVRELCNEHPHRLRFFLAYVRAFGAEVAERHDIENRVEEDIEKAMGFFYEAWAP